MSAHAGQLSLIPNPTQRRTAEDGGGFEFFWRAVWKKTAKESAQRAYRQAVKSLMGERRRGREDAEQFIFEAARSFAETPAGSDGGLFDSYVSPYPATWLRSARYLDDRKAWGMPRLARAGHCANHPRSGSTVTGACWGCAHGYPPDAEGRP